jgi:methyl-accepting chemotaxis protein
MALPPETVVGTVIFRLPEDAAGLRQKRRIWKYFAPYALQAIDGHIDRMIEHVPFLTESLAVHREPYRQLVLRVAEGLFTRPVDEQQMINGKDQVALEIKIGFDLRSRGTLNQAIIGGLIEGLKHSRWVSKRAALEMIDLASRILALDTATGVAFHYQAKARETQAKAAELREAIGQFSKTIQAGRGLATSSVTSLGATAGELTDLAHYGADQAETAAQAASDTALNVARVANSTEELFASINNIREQAASSARMADAAVAQTDETNRTILSLSEAVDKIGSVVGLISDIATSTNMLALNATIEASRAGEAGRGFAVVAAEVKSLAKQTSQATQEIGKQIAVIQQAARSAVEQIGTSSQAIAGIASIAVAVSHSVDQQAGATGSIAEGVNGAARNATTVAEALHVIEDTVCRTRDASQAALSLSEQLAESARNSGVAMDALFEAASKNDGMRVMKPLTRLHGNQT